MAMEPGPARLFDLSSIDLSIEAALTDADTQIQVDGLAEIDKSLDLKTQALTATVGELNTQTFALGEVLALPEAEIGAYYVAPDTAMPADIVQGASDTDTALAAAQEAVPDIPTPQPPLPPSYPPPWPPPPRINMPLEP